MRYIEASKITNKIEEQMDLVVISQNANYSNGGT
jgi:hypothetical protein